MGLDMYLFRMVHVEKQNQISTEEEEAAYWRKANHIHKWFVDNVQNGIDDCGRYYVSREKLQELLDTCKKVLENKELAEKLLPTQEGFFFGGTDYEEYYFDSIKSTIQILNKILKDDCGEFFYESSW